MHVRAKFARWQPTVLLLLLAGSSCNVTPADIERWKHTEKGPGKLRAVLHDGAQPVPLRAQAALALIEIQRGSEVEEELGRLPEPVQRGLVRLVIPPLMTMLAGQAPVARQGAAKDALFQLRTLSDPADRALVDEALVSWTTADLIGRMSLGRVGTEEILTTIGQPAQGALLLQISAATVDAPQLLPAAALLGRVADPETKDRAAALLLAMLPAAPAEKQGRLLQSLAAVGGAVAAQELIKVALSDRHSPALRGQALAALRDVGDPGALKIALRLAGDPREVPVVREAAFAYLEKIGEIAVSGLCKIITDPQDRSDKGEIARFRAVEAALSAGGEAAVLPVLEALPPQRAYDREDLVAYVVHQLTPLKNRPGSLEVMKKALQSKSWVARSAAILALSELRQGEAEIAALTSDSTRLQGRGWPVATVGELAAASKGTPDGSK